MKVASEEIKYWSDRFYQEGYNTDEDYFKKVDFSRQQLALLLGAEKQNIAFFQSTSQAISQFALNIELKEDDEVLMLKQEYSSHLYPWQAACKKAKAKLVLLDSIDDYKVSTEIFKSQVNAKTKVIAVSWVQFQTGSVIDIYDLGAFCKSRNIVFFIDIIQGLGTMPFDFIKSQATAVAGGSHKWLSSAVGVGYLCISDPDACKMQPHSFGAYTFGTCEDPSDLLCEPKLNASKFEPGSKQVLEICSLGVCCEIINQVGVRELQKEIIDLNSYFIESYNNKKISLVITNDEIINGFVNLVSDVYEPKKIKEDLNGKSIFCALRGPGVRLSFAAFNSKQEIQSLLNLF